MSKSNPFGKPADESEEFSVDLSDVQGFQIPAGDYPGKLLSVEYGKSKAGNPMFTWAFVIIGDKCAGKEFKTFTATTPQALWKVAEVLKALGMAAEGSVVKFKKEQVEGKRVLLRIEDTVYNDEPSSTIGKVLAHPDGPDMPRVGDPLAGGKKAKRDVA